MSVGVAVSRQNLDELNNVLEAKKAAGNAENALEASNIYLSVRVTPEKSTGKKSNVKVNVTPEMKDAFYKKYKESSLYSENAKTKIDESRILKLTTSEDQWGRFGIHVCHACHRSWAYRVPNLSNTSLEGAVCSI